MGFLADSFDIIELQPRCAIYEVEQLLVQIEPIEHRLDELIRRHLNVMVKLQAIVSKDWWWPNYCIEKEA